MGLLLTVAAPIAACTGYEDSPKSEFDNPDGGDGSVDKKTGAVPRDGSVDEKTATVPLDELPWPRQTTQLPSCTSWGTFKEPELQPPQGDVYLDLSARLQPVGVDERIAIKVRSAGTSVTDTGVNGALSLDVGNGATVLETANLVGGKGEAVVRFLEPGLHTVRASIDGDTRTGSVQVMAYQTQLPVWSMTITENDLDQLMADPWQNVTVPAVITVEGEAYVTEVRLHGGSSRDFKKHSFRFDLGPTLALSDTSDHIVLRSEWNDKTMLRNFLSQEVFRNASWVPAPNTEIIHFRINRRYYGVMWHAERIDGDFLRRRGLNNDTGAMYESDPPAECWNPGGGLYPLNSLATYQCVYDQKKGDVEYKDLIELIEETLQLPDSEFIDVIDQVVNVDEYLVYMAVMAVIQNLDHVKKNFYLYRDPYGKDKRWMVFPWDLELTLGHLWTEENDVLDETIFADKPLVPERCPWPGKIGDTAFCNQLMTRIYLIPKYQHRFEEFVDFIIENSFTEKLIGDRIDSVICRATPDILADSMKRASNNEYLDRVEEIRQFVRQRRAFIQSL